MNLSTTDIANLRALLNDLSPKEIGEIINEQDQNKYTALQYACTNNNEQGVKLLLDHGANPNQTHKLRNQLSQSIIDLLDDAMTKNNLGLS